MKIWRIEYPDGTGPYTRTNSLAKTLGDAHSNSKKHPGVCKDCGVSYPFICGFASLKDYTNWFKDEFRKEISKWGLVLALYKIKKRRLKKHEVQKYYLVKKRDAKPFSNIQKGKKQVAFLRDEAELIAKYDPNIKSPQVINLTVRCDSLPRLSNDSQSVLYHFEVLKG